MVQGRRDDRDVLVEQVRLSTPETQAAKDVLSVLVQMGRGKMWCAR